MPKEATEGLETIETAEDATTEEEAVAEEQQAEEPFEESPDDVKKARAFHQSEAQDAKADNKRLAAKNADLNFQLEEVISKYENGMSIPPAPETPEPGDSPDEEDYDDPVMKRLNRLDHKIDQLAQSNAAAKQYELNERYKQEITDVNKALTAIVKEAVDDERVTQEQIADAATYARSVVTDQDYQTILGAPSRRARVFRDQLRLLELESEKAIPKATRGTHADKAEAMNAATQPAGGAVPPPTTKVGEKSANDQLADEIYPDDEDFVPVE